MIKIDKVKVRSRKGDPIHNEVFDSRKLISLMVNLIPRRRNFKISSKGKRIIEKRGDEIIIEIEGNRIIMKVEGIERV